MATLSLEQIGSVAFGAGFRGDDLAIAIAVAMAESGGNTDAHNRNDTGGTQSFGLWQINSVHTDLLSAHNWRDPKDNARMAMVIHQRQGWNAWGAFTNQSYRLHLARATLVARALREGGLINPDIIPDIDVPNPVEEIRETLDFVTDPHTWLRVVTVVAGIVLLGLLLAALMRQTDAFQLGKKVAKTVVTRKMPAKAQVVTEAVAK
jgi:hypothetical protein